LKTYVDSSVLLRVVLREPDRLAGWDRIEQPVASELIRLECLRTIDRARIQRELGDEDVARQRASVIEALEYFELIPLTSIVLERASEPLPTVVGSLDAIHLASALLARRVYDHLAFATHDRRLAIAATAMGFTVSE